MRLTTLTIATIATTTASAQLLDIGSLLSSLAPASGNDPRFTDFQAPGPNDVRSPCPGLNALANHNFIHRSGRNMTIPHLLKGLAAGMNMGADFTTVVGGAGLLASADPASGAFDLNDLNQHNFPVEHDASASRQDEFFGNYVDFYQPSWDMVLDAYAGREQTDIETAAGALYVRYNDSVTRNPEFVMGLREFTFRFGETAIYIQTMGDPVSGNANLDYVRMLFEQEKLPYELGWRPSAAPITLMSLGNMVFELFGASPEQAKQGFNIAVDTLKDVNIALVGGSAALSRLTDGISERLGL